MRAQVKKVGRCALVTSPEASVDERGAWSDGRACLEGTGSGLRADAGAAPRSGTPRDTEHTRQRESQA